MPNSCNIFRGSTEQNHSVPGSSILVVLTAESNISIYVWDSLLFFWSSRISFLFFGGGTTIFGVLYCSCYVQRRTKRTVARRKKWFLHITTSGRRDKAQGTLRSVNVLTVLCQYQVSSSLTIRCFSEETGIAMRRRSPFLLYLHDLVVPPDRNGMRRKEPKKSVTSCQICHPRGKVISRTWFPILSKLNTSRPNHLIWIHFTHPSPPWFNTL